jgi:endonuclease YncB( thermonuclease family)
VFGKEVRVMVVDTDRYGRTVGRVYTDALDVNSEMVRQGAAWWYRKYNRDPALLLLGASASGAGYV